MGVPYFFVFSDPFYGRNLQKIQIRVPHDLRKAYDNFFLKLANIPLNNRHTYLYILSLRRVFFYKISEDTPSAPKSANSKPPL